MPTYDYQCPKCKVTIEHYSAFSETTAPMCDCGQTMQKIYSSPGVIFKGDGWAGKS